MLGWCYEGRGRGFLKRKGESIWVIYDEEGVVAEVTVPEELVGADGEGGVGKDFQNMPSAKNGGSGRGPNRKGLESGDLLERIYFNPLLNGAVGVVNIKLGKCNEFWGRHSSKIGQVRIHDVKR